jgi:hypothetical protein
VELEDCFYKRSIAAKNRILLVRQKLRPLAADKLKMRSFRNKEPERTNRKIKRNREKRNGR